MLFTNFNCKNKIKTLNKNIKIFTINDEIIDIVETDITNQKPKRKLWNVINQNNGYSSDVCEEMETPRYKVMDKKICGNNKKKLVSQEFECPSDDYILSTRKTQPYAPVCDINDLKEQRMYDIQITTDISGKTSLQQDYDFIDDFMMV